MRASTVEQFALLIAAGLDPQRSTIFVQSHVAAHAELHWLLEATAFDGEPRRMIQYKEKAARQRSVRAALLAYPILMAADILLYEVDAVPVGDDQRQHLELARTLATRFNRQYGKTFVVPRAVTPPVAARVMDLLDPTSKMSKSAPTTSAGVIRLLDTPDVVRRKVTRAHTDTGRDVSYEPETKPGVSNLIEITAACSGTTFEQVINGCNSYAELKSACIEAVVALLAPIQDRYTHIIDDQTALTSAIPHGAEAARTCSAPTLTRAKSAIGLLSA